MSGCNCWGTPISDEKPAGEQNRQQSGYPPAAQPISQQPTFQGGPQYPGQEKALPTPGLPSPPVAAHLRSPSVGTPPPNGQGQAFNYYANHPASTSPPPFSPVNGYNVTTTPPPPAMPMVAHRVSSVTPATSPSQAFNTPTNEGRMSVSIDFGTTFSGVAYGSARIAAGKVQQIIHWPGSDETFRKIPTCLLYDLDGHVIAWGIEAKNAPVDTEDVIRCEWFKLFLEPQSLRDSSAADPRLPSLPPGKTALDVIMDFLSCLWEYAQSQITREIGSVADLNSADVWITVPAAWDAKGCQLMREAAIEAGLVRASSGTDHNYQERLHIITEPEAAAVHCALLTDLHKLRPSQTFMICDAGGGTVDLATYKIIGQLSSLEIAEMTARSGANCGSLFLDFRFRELVSALLADHPVHLQSASLASFMRSFSENEKLQYEGVAQDDVMFQWDCFESEDLDDPSIGLINGQLSIPGRLLRQQVFDPVVDEALELIEGQLRRINQRVDALLLVGGFGSSNYLFGRVQERFASRIRVIARPFDMDSATLRGAAQYGLSQRRVVSSVIAPRSYLIKVKLPAEDEDRMKRPAYISRNNAGAEICENRLQYLVMKGAILRKGQRVTTKFSKFSLSAQDSVFVATLYTSDEDRVYRYIDEGETAELCKWTVDLSVLPVFQMNAQMHAMQPGGFFTDFELALELDSAEVRGVLVHDGRDWGGVVFEFLN